MNNNLYVEYNLIPFVFILHVSSSYRRRYNVSRFHTISARRSSFVSFFWALCKFFLKPDLPSSRFLCSFRAPSILKHSANCNQTFSTCEILSALYFPLQNFQIQQISRTRTGRNCQWYLQLSNKSPQRAESSAAAAFTRARAVSLAGFSIN